MSAGEQEGLSPSQLNAFVPYPARHARPGLGSEALAAAAGVSVW